MANFVRIYGAGDSPGLPGAVADLTLTMQGLIAELSWVNPSSNWVKTRILRKEGSAPTGPKDGAVVYEGTETNLTQAGLTDGATYYWAAYPLNLVGKAGPGVSVSGMATEIDPADWVDCVPENIAIGYRVYNAYTQEYVTGAMPYVKGLSAAISRIIYNNSANVLHKVDASEGISAAAESASVWCVTCTLPGRYYAYTACSAAQIVVRNAANGVMRTVAAGGLGAPIIFSLDDTATIKFDYTNQAASFLSCIVRYAADAVDSEITPEIVRKGVSIAGVVGSKNALSPAVMLNLSSTYNSGNAFTPESSSTNGSINFTVETGSVFSCSSISSTTGTSSIRFPDLNTSVYTFSGGVNVGEEIVIPAGNGRIYGATGNSGGMDFWILSKN